jgi:Family of unknown function (DUF5681)
MKRIERTRPRLRASAGKRVGYATPPDEHKFRPGQSGNPKGRAKGSKNESTILRELLERKIEMRSNGRARKVTVLEAMLLRFVEDALKGNVKTGAFLLNRFAARLSGELRPEDLTDDDREVLEAFAKRIQIKKQESADE